MSLAIIILSSLTAVTTFCSNARTKKVVCVILKYISSTSLKIASVVWINKINKNMKKYLEARSADTRSQQSLPY